MGGDAPPTPKTMLFTSRPVTVKGGGAPRRWWLLWVATLDHLLLLGLAGGQGLAVALCIASFSASHELAMACLWLACQAWALLSCHGLSGVLVDIWEERKVFGSRGRSLKDEMLAKNPLSSSVSNGKSSNPIKIVKRDAHSVRIKLAVGGLPEKILTAFQSVLDQHLAEEATLNNCNDAVHHVGRIEEDVESSLTQGHQQGSAVVDELLEQENLLKQCIGQLEGAQATRSALISQLKEALQDQESKLELIRSQLQVRIIIISLSACYYCLIC
ncbi:hypothetical protein CJ030_MR2G013653 [Morella rubra]|uniref:Uncharacterized protein n=1 Tax=Morella rubra TaxID=262757 RepID=A0A6A1WCS4_9ROSI|nr:hypothetical protein CJ030_MR2G013653 [Morella rubra]